MLRRSRPPSGVVDGVAVLSFQTEDADTSDRMEYDYASGSEAEEDPPPDDSSSDPNLSDHSSPSPSNTNSNVR